jgi:hypothetical protein
VSCTYSCCWNRNTIWRSRSCFPAFGYSVLLTSIFGLCGFVSYSCYFVFKYRKYSCFLELRFFKNLKSKSRFRPRSVAVTTQAPSQEKTRRSVQQLFSTSISYFEDVSLQASKRNHERTPSVNGT